MNKGILLLIYTVIFSTGILKAQDTLPKFSLQGIGKDKIQISWVNPYPNCIQLNIQRSYNEETGFRTIFDAQSPSLPQNGHVDIKPPTDKMYYRIFYVLSGGRYFFSKAMNLAQGYESAPIATMDETKMIVVKLNDVMYATMPFQQYKRFHDSILAKTKDSLIVLDDDTVSWRKYVPTYATWQPSDNLFINREGYITLNLPSAKTKKYKLIIYGVDGKELFQINQIKDTHLILEKGVFMRSGWYTFDLYEDGEIKEKNKFFLAKEF